MEVLSLINAREQMEVTRALLLLEGNGEARASINPVVGAREGQPRILPGRNLNEDDLINMSLALSGGQRRRCVLPPHVLVAELGMVCWWRPIVRRAVFFETNTAFDKEANAKDALHPPFVFIGRRGGGLTVYSLAGNERPTGSTRLYRAPSYNLYGHGAMCVGNVPVPQQATIDTIPEFERAFYDSSAVHTNLGGKDLTKHPQGHNGLWRELIACTHNHFPFHWLVPLEQGGEPMTLDMAINLK